jgi:site-specific DNA-cytosine methylase
MKFIDLCCGVGGIRAGFEAAGWENVLSVDINSDAIELHKKAFGSGEVEDIQNLTGRGLPKFDVLASGFPCQPFSSSGNRKGFKHNSGNVLENLLRIIANTSPSYIVLENVQGILSNSYGYTMAKVLHGLTNAGYQVSWLLFNSLWLGIPQERKRLLILAELPKKNSPFSKDLFGDVCFDISSQLPLKKLIPHSGIAFGNPNFGSLEDVILKRKPRVGRKKPEPVTPFLTAGIAENDSFATWKLSGNCEPDNNMLGSICCPEFYSSNDVRSIRYWGHSGITKFYIKDKPWAHSIGTNIGAAPTFAVEMKKIKNKNDREKVLQYSNWNRVDSKYFIFRLSPSRACLLFGNNEIKEIKNAFQNSGVSLTKKYVLLGNMVVPLKFKKLAQWLSNTNF